MIISKELFINSVTSFKSLVGIGFDRFVVFCKYIVLDLT